VNSDAEVAVWPPTTTVIRPVVASAGTIAVSDAGEDTVTTAAAPLNRTALPAGSGSNPAPHRVTEVPAGPEAGEKVERVGASTPAQEAAQAASATAAALRAVLIASPSQHSPHVPHPVPGRGCQGAPSGHTPGAPPPGLSRVAAGLPPPGDDIWTVPISLLRGPGGP